MSDLPPISETSHRLIKTLEEAIYEPIDSLRIEAWRSAEPLPFERRREGEHLRLQIGEIWGRELFDCAWMRFTSDFSGDPGKVVARIDVNGELCVVDAAGQPLRGLTNKKSEFAPALGSPAKVICPLDPSHLRDGRVEIWADAAFNDLFGRIQSEGRIEVAELVRLREDVRALFYDVELCADFVANAPETEAAAGEIRELLGEVDRLIGAGTRLPEDMVAEARRMLSPVFERSADTNFRISAVGHAHLDLAWLWPIRESKRKGARTFATALANLEKYPDYVFGCSQPQLFVWMEESYPELFLRLKDAAAKGRIELLGTFWVEPDCNIPNGESLVRQVVHGRRYFEETFGIVPGQCWQPDVFGYNGQLPQILSKSGHDAFMTQKLSWNSVNRFPHHSFQWLGIDGSRLPAHCLPEETYNGPASAASVLKIRDDYSERELSSQALMVYGIGDGGAGPGEAHLERLKRLERFSGLPPVVSEPSSEFFPRWLGESGAFPEWRGELYLERHQGTFTTIAAVKRYNRRCETALRELEVLASLAEIQGKADYPAEALDRIWKEVLLYQFHDVLPGSSIKRVYDECLPRYARLVEEIEALAVAAARALAGAQAAPGEGKAVFNPLNWSRTEWFSNDGVWHRLKLPAFGWQGLGETPETAGFEAPVASKGHLENECLRVEFGEDGSIRSLVEKDGGSEFLREGASGNAFQIIEDRGDAWDFGIDPETKDVAAYLKLPSESPELVEAVATCDGPRATLEQRYRFRESTLRLRISLDSGSSQLRFDAEVDWQERKHLLRVIFPTSIRADSARYEIPFGSIRRVTHEDDSLAQAQFEVPAQQWVDLSEQGRGLALLNDCKYGFRIKDGCVAMSLIRSVPYPGAALIEATDASVEEPASDGEVSDLGRHVFAYALRVHDGSLSEGELTRAARAFNQALRLTPATGKHAEGSLLELDSNEVEVAALKKAESGRGYVLRLVNLSSAPVRAGLRFGFSVSEIEEVDLVEQRVESTVELAGARLSFSLSPFEIRSYRFEPG